ncbi:MAG: cytochrome b/b6 domain-containing protein [Chloroflexi bacterium]|nr:cytochrome b/b6 domain-containing protein [Chloroflexota bacterium]
MNRVSLSEDVLISLGLQDNVEFIRFSLVRRVEHFLLIISFVALAATGLPQKFNAADWAQWMLTAMGGIETTRWLHHFFAIVFIMEGIFHVVYAFYGLLRRRVGLEMLPAWKDVRAFQHMALYFIGKRQAMPKFGRYDYRQKFEYFAMVWGWLLMAATGLIMWQPTWATNYLPGILIPVGKMLHGWEAVLAVLSIVIWHGYHVIFHPDVFPVDSSIFSGRISRMRMINEHPLEFEEAVGRPAIVEGLKRG